MAVLFVSLTITLITMKLISLRRAGGVGRGDGRDRGGDEEGAQWRVYKVEIFSVFLVLSWEFTRLKLISQFLNSHKDGKYQFLKPPSPLKVPDCADHPLFAKPGENPRRPALHRRKTFQRGSPATHNKMII